MASVRKSEPIRSFFSSFRPWVKVRQCIKLHPNMSKMAEATESCRLNTRVYRQTPDDQEVILNRSV